MKQYLYSVISQQTVESLSDFIYPHHFLFTCVGKYLIDQPTRVKAYRKILIQLEQVCIPCLIHHLYVYVNYHDSKLHGANRGPIWARQNPGVPHFGPMNFAIWDVEVCIHSQNS